MCALDMLQFHGGESPEFCSKFKKYKVIKAFRIKNKFELAKLKAYKTSAYLFDTFSNTHFGGTGKKFNWNLLPEKGKINNLLFLSGGLDAKNVSRALKRLNPDWVDLSSSVEYRPGKKDHGKIRDFIKKVK